VVNDNLKMKSIENMRIVNASIMRCPIDDHYQKATYAITEQAAELTTKGL
jgi:choline dehydrogenase-like flavoprotein